MKLLKSLLIVMSPLFFSCTQGADFQKYFQDRTMRLNYYHTGTATEEHIAFDGIVSDGIWAGCTSQLVDNLNLGKYYFEVIDLASKKVIYSKGFSSVYGEWETTPEAKNNWGSFHESIRFPWPKADAKVVLKKRNANYTFSPIWEYTIDQKSWRCNLAKHTPIYKTDDILVNGDPKHKVDIVILSEGYTKDEMELFKADAKRFMKTMLATEPYASRKSDFNFRAVEVPAAQSGLAHPHQDIYKTSALGVSYGIFNSERYALTFDNKAVRKAAACVPYDYTVILMNDSIYGGGGIYHTYITAAAHNGFSKYLFVHEFGHHFADLADEYYTSSTAYEMGTELKEPWELNVTTQTERSKIKWKDLIDKDTPIPTPWGKKVFDEHSIKTQKERVKLRAAKTPEYLMNKFFNEQRVWEENYLNSIKYAGKAGLYEGGQYHSHGIYRSAPNCIMFTRTDHFCPACKRALNMVIDQYVK